jgi:hypothetical protein
MNVLSASTAMMIRKNTSETTSKNPARNSVNMIPDSFACRIRETRNIQALGHKANS